jgi:hypothetical protein
VKINNIPYNALAYEKLKFWEIKEIQLCENLRQVTWKGNYEKHKLVSIIRHSRYATELIRLPTLAWSMKQPMENNMRINGLQFFNWNEADDHLEISSDW